MQQIIFSKFSNERANKFQIRTDILKEDNGALCVRKAAACEEAKEHIAKIEYWYKELTKVYEAVGMKANKAVLSADSSYVDLEYLTGGTYQDVLDDLYAKGSYEELQREILAFAKKVKSIGEQVEFTKSEAFVEVFGDPDFETQKLGAKVNNIDLIFANIILNDGWNIIDYEWTFDFVIPADFIIYRAVHYYFVSGKRSEISVKDMYAQLNITEKEQEIYQEMERNFQLYILGDTLGCNNLYPLIAGYAYDVEDILNAQKNLIKKDRIQVYYDLGNDFDEKDSIWITPKEGQEGVYEFELPDGIKALRVDPGEQQGVLNFKEYSLVGEKDIELAITANGEHLCEGRFVFDNNDPYLLFEGFEGKGGLFSISFEYEPMDDATIHMIKPLVKVREEKEDILKRYDALFPKYNMVDEQYKALKVEHYETVMKASEYEQVKGSAYWKATKPMRAFFDGINNFFHSNLWLLMGMKDFKKLLKLKNKELVKKSNEEEWDARKTMHVLPEISLVYEAKKMQAELEEVKKCPQDVKFSVVVPVYNTPHIYLRKMIESVIAQTYENWELVLVDASDKKHKEVGNICKEYAWYDKRVIYHKLKKNLGIADNTNAALELATGDFIALFDHDDFLHPSALYENYKAVKDHGADFMYSDENTFHVTIDDAFNPHYKPDFSPDYLRSVNYICHLTVFSRALYEKVGGFNKEYDGSQDYDMILRLTEVAGKIYHIRKVLYYWRAHAASTAQDIHAKDYCMDSAKRALKAHLNRVGLKGNVLDAAVLSWYRIQYEIKGNPKISIIIPNKDHVELLKTCVDSVLNVSTYKNVEIIIVENNSMLASTFDYYESLKDEKRVKVVTWEQGFNYSAINNFGASFATGEYILLLNNDMEVIAPNWLEEMLMFAQRDEVGAVGAKLYYSNDTVQHAGVILGIGGVAGHSHKYYAKNDPGYFARLVVAQDLSAVTAACMLMKKSVFDQVGGLDEAYQVAFNDVDLCMKIRKAGYLIVYTPYAELYHYESISRGAEDTPEKVERFNGEVNRFMERWGEELEAGDPYYNPNLTLVYEDFREKEEC